MACMRGLRRLFQEGEETTNPQPTNTSPVSYASLATTGWILACNTVMMPDVSSTGEEKIVISAPLPWQVCHQQPLVKLPLVWEHNVAPLHVWYLAFKRGWRQWSWRREHHFRTALVLKSALDKDFSVSLLDCFHFYHNQLSGWFTWSTFMDFVIYLRPAALLRKTSGRNCCSGEW